MTKSGVMPEKTSSGFVRVSPSLCALARMLARLAGTDPDDPLSAPAAWISSAKA
jgi:hypothetical protein